METVSTFIFVILILFITGKRTEVADLGIFGPHAICLNLYALIQVNAFTGASFNPALNVGATIFQCWFYPVNPSGVLYFYSPFYFIADLLGGALAGIFYIVYEKAYPEKGDRDSIGSSIQNRTP